MVGWEDSLEGFWPGEFGGTGLEESPRGKTKGRMRGWFVVGDVFDRALAMFLVFSSWREQEFLGRGGLLLVNPYACIESGLVQRT